MAWPRVEGLATPGEQRAYLIKIVVNEALQILRDPRRQREQLGADVAGLPSMQPSFEDEIQAKEDLRLVWKAVSDMPGMRRAVVLLRAADAQKLIGRARAARDVGAVDFWSVLSPTERNHFESASRLREVPPGTVLMREGEQAGEVIVIRDGWTKVTVREDGRERAIAERGPGDLIGEAGTEPGNVRSASVTAVSQVWALAMTTAGYAAFIADHPDVPDLIKKQTHDRGPGQP